MMNLGLKLFHFVPEDTPLLTLLLTYLTQLVLLSSFLLLKLYPVHLKLVLLGF